MLYELTSNEVGIINIIRNMNPYDKMTIQRNGDSDSIEFKIHYDQSVFFKRKIEEHKQVKDVKLVVIAKEMENPIDFLKKV